MNILITGGAGYKGSKLSQLLLKDGHRVTCIDNFLTGYNSILNLLPNKNYNVLKKDIRELAKNDLQQFEVIYHLAGLSGFISCESSPSEAKVVNIDATKKIFKQLSNDQWVIYPSTTSLYGNYGIEIDEETKPKPNSIYAQTKYDAEKIILNRENSVSLRFASVFGLSLNMRHDLMVHDFIRRAISDKALVLYDSKSIRSFVHINDAIKAYLFTLDNFKKMKGQIYNVGLDKLNLSKADLAEEIKKHINFEIIESKMEDKEKRDYFTKYDKIEKLGFKSQVSIGQGVEDLIKFYLLRVYD